MESPRLSRRGGARVVLLVLIVLVLGIGIAWLVREDAASSVGALSSEPPASTAEPGPESSLAELETPEPVAVSPEAPRSSVSAAALRGRVLDATGAPVRDAVVSWSIVEVSDGELDLLGEAFERLVATTRETRTDESGAYEHFEAPAGGGDASGVVWVTHPDFLASHALVDAVALPAVQNFELEPADELGARVEDASGAPVPGALVRQAANFPLADGLSIEGSERVALRAFCRTWTSDGEGRVRLAPLAYRQRAVARHESLLSEEWIGRQPDEIVLRLGATFTARGSVRTDDPDIDLERLRVIVSDRRTAGYALLARTAVDEHGRWGPLVVPLPRGDAIQLALRGENVAGWSIDREAPAAGAEIVVDLVAARGLSLPVRVVSTRGDAVPDAWVQALWQSEDRWMAADADSDEDGLATVQNCAPGYLWIRVGRAGYSSRMLDAVSYSVAPAEPVRVELEPAGRLTGRVVLDGEPVRTFNATLWGGDLSDRNHLVFEGRADGTFEVDEAPLGRVHVQVSTRELPPCAPLEVEVIAGETAHVEVEMTPAVVGRGRVVDLLTGEGLGDALIHAYGAWGDRTVDPWGPPRSVAADGTFELAAFTSGKNVFLVSAPGYADRYDIVSGASRAELDLGTLALTPTQELVVRAHGPEGTDFTEWTALAMKGSWSSETVPLSAEGTAVVAQVPPGDVTVRVSKVVAGFDTQLELRPGEPWTLDVELPDTSRPPLRIEVVHAPGARAVPDLVTLRISSKHEDGRVRTDYANGAPGLVAEVHGTFEAELLIDALHPQTYEVLGVERVLEPTTLPSPVRVEVGGPGRAFGVVDLAGEPLGGTTVFLLPDDGGAGLSIRGTTGSDGTCRLHVPASVELARAFLYHPTAGAVADVPVEMPRDREQTIELVLDATATARLTFLDGADPVQGVVAKASTRPGGDLNLSTTPSDPTGACTLGPTRPGTYYVRPVSPGFWPVEHAVEVREPALDVPLQLRRLGSLVIETRTPTGVPVENVKIELVSVELGQSVRTWVAEARVQSSDPGLDSDSAGSLRLIGLPRGDYTWRATFPGGAITSGSVTVPAGDTGRVVIEGAHGF